MTPTELAVEDGLIRAGAWWPGLRAQIIASVGDKALELATSPDLIDALIARQRETHPERFLPETVRDEIGNTKDPAARYQLAVAKISDFRRQTLRELESIRESEEWPISGAT